MNYAVDDRHRSLRRFVMNAVGSPPWRVRTERQPVADEQRPVAVVEASTPMVTTAARVSIPQGNVTRQQTFALVLYPVIGESAAEARLEAERVAELLGDAIDVGLVDDDGALLTAPQRIPVYDFAGVAVKGADRRGGADPYGWLWVEDAPVSALQDPEDPLRWTVACDMRVSWEQAGRDRPQAEPFEPVRAFGGSWLGHGPPPVPEPVSDDVTVGHGPPGVDVTTQFYLDEDSGLLYERSP